MPTMGSMHKSRKERQARQTRKVNKAFVGGDMRVLRPKQPRIKELRREAAYAVRVRSPGKIDGCGSWGAWLWMTERNSVAIGRTSTVWWERALMTRAQAFNARDVLRAAGHDARAVCVWRDMRASTNATNAAASGAMLSTRGALPSRDILPMRPPTSRAAAAA